MAKKRSAAAKQSRPDRRAAPVDAAQGPSFLSKGSIRETIESIVVAFILAFLFRAFEAEAFVIPTGSMAPTLMGAHKDIACPQCGYQYAAGASSESDDVAQQGGYRGPLNEVVDVTCPLCRYTVNVDPQTPEGREYPTYGGDRILVTKFTFDFAEPRRWDVTVFKFPGGAETNYIKRMVGLPNETLRIWHGDVYIKAPGEKRFHLERRPPAKLQAMAQVVYDNDYVVDAMTKKGWPVRWQPVPDGSAAAESVGWTTSDGSRSYEIDGSEPNVRWLGYQHFVPDLNDWKRLDQGPLPKDYQPKPSLITDFYGYDTSVQRNRTPYQAQFLGRHWVGDLLLECQLEVTKPEGTANFELVKGGAHFRCEIDCATGEATLAIDARDDYKPRAETRVRGAGSHQVEFANVDNQLWLWIDGSPIAFDAETTYPPLGNDHPQSNEQDPGDLLPARIGAHGAGLRVSDLRLRRDIYYIATTGHADVTDYSSPSALVYRLTYDQLAEFWKTPAEWNPATGPNPFDQRGEAVFPLAEDQFFMLGDNSPLSLDARLWSAEPYVDRKLLVGKALYIFWPHSFDTLPGTPIPFPFFPNFARMKFIR